jgi:hypothetical protein
VEALTVLYVLFLAGAATGCGAFARLVLLGHREDR